MNTVIDMAEKSENCVIEAPYAVSLNVFGGFV